MTYTVATMEVPDIVYEQIKAKLLEAGYGHTIGPDGMLDMSGIGLVSGPRELPKGKASYVADKTYPYLYPGAGDEKPPGGAQVLLLTAGGICVRGSWDPRYFLGWAPMPGRDLEKERSLK